jgi:proline iminopeptidase
VTRRPALVFDDLPSPHLDGMLGRLDDVLERTHARRPSWVAPARAADAGDLSGWIENAEAARREAGVEKTVIMGMSFCGCLALAYAAAHPERVLGALVWGCAPAFDDPGAFARAQARATPAQLAALQRVFAGELTDEADVLATVRTLLPVYVDDPTRLDMDALLEGFGGRASTWNHVVARVVPALSLTGRLGGVRCPVMVLAGRRDWLTPPEQAARLLAELPDATLEVFEHSGHFLHVEEPERFEALVRGWLARLASPD